MINLESRVLVIDDNSEIHGDFMKILGETRDTKHLRTIESELFGNEVEHDSEEIQTCRVISALQGDIGVDLYRSTYLTEPFDVVFVDMRMPPGWDGLRTIKEIWSINPDQFVVLCSAYSDYSFDTLRKELGNRPNFLILNKPFRSDEIKQIVNSIAHREPLKLRSERKISIELGKAILNQELSLVFQPVLDLQQNTLKGYESLCRWSVDGKTIANPNDFVRIAEDFGLIHQLGDWVAESAISFSSQLKHVVGSSCLPLITFNVSVLQLDDSFVNKMINLCNKYSVRVQDIGIEITESNVMSDVEHCQAVLLELSRLGFDILIDDFGSGNSSLFTLFKLPYHFIKIDRLFTKDIVQDTNSRIIVKSMIDLCHSLNKSFVAEGVESQDQLNVLSELGCDYAQGYLVSKPLSLEDALYFAQHGLRLEQQFAA